MVLAGLSLCAFCVPFFGVFCGAVVVVVLSWGRHSTLLFIFVFEFVFSSLASFSPLPGPFFVFFFFVTCLATLGYRSRSCHIDQMLGTESVVSSNLSDPG